MTVGQKSKEVKLLWKPQFYEHQYMGISVLARQ